VSAAALADKHDGEELLSLASDGRDHGLFAGAICDLVTKNAAVAAGVDAETFLAQNNIAAFFDKVGGYVKTGDTGSNVSDLIIALKM
jgi:glycerate-2-kinase